MKYFISAGEASGDIHAAALIEALKASDVDAHFTFLGGDLMAAAADCEPLIHYRRMAFMGFCEVARNLRTVLGNLRTAKEALAQSECDALILVDYPSFNLKLAKEAHRLGIPVYYYISPKVWAWKEKRVKKIRRYCRRVLSILPFEVEFYRERHGYDVDYVGNPSVGETRRRLREMLPETELRASLGLPADKPVLALVPGSRRGEIRNNLPVMARVAALHPEFHAVVASAPGIDDSIYDSLCSLPRIGGHTFELMAISQAALVTSGTATLEAALLSTPQVVCYRANGSRISYGIFKRILKIPFVSLPNLIAGRRVVAEQLVHHCNVSEVNAELTPLLSDTPVRRDMLEGYADILSRLTDADAAVASAALILTDLSEGRVDQP